MLTLRPMLTCACEFLTHAIALKKIIVARKVFFMVFSLTVNVFQRRCQIRIKILQMQDDELIYKRENVLLMIYLRKSTMKRLEYPLILILPQITRMNTDKERDNVISRIRVTRDP